MKNPVIHKFRTPYNYYIYDLGTNYIARINKELFEYDFIKDEYGLLSDESMELLNEFKEVGLFTFRKVHTIEHPETKFLNTLLDRNINALVLQLTQQCNLRCKYCVYSGQYNTRSHNNAKMTFELAQKSIDFLISHSIESPYISVGFYGGEPLLEYELIKKCVEYTNKASEGRCVYYNITTNATLLSNEIVEFFIRNNIDLTISLDGDKESHDKNRVFVSNKKGTYDVVVAKLSMIKEQYPDYYKKIMFNVVLDSNGNFNDLNYFFTNHPIVKDSIVKSSYINNNYSKKEFKGNEAFNISRNYEMLKLYLNKLGFLTNYNVSKILIQEFDSIKHLIANRTTGQLLPQRAHHGGPCVPGVQRLFVDIHGNFYPCERVSENSEVIRIGNIEKGFNIEKVREILNVGKLTEKSCKSCWAFRFCGLCAAYADGIEKLDANKKLSNCNSIKRTIDAKLKAYMMLNEFNYDFN